MPENIQDVNLSQVTGRNKLKYLPGSQLTISRQYVLVVGVLYYPVVLRQNAYLPCSNLDMLTAQ